MFQGFLKNSLEVSQVCFKSVSSQQPEHMEGFFSKNEIVTTPTTTQPKLTSTEV